MLHGVLKKQRLLLLPWMVLHLGATVGALIYCGVEYDKIEGQRALFIIGSVVQGWENISPQNKVLAFWLALHGYFIEIEMKTTYVQF